jgi:hypothetical protein
MYVIFQSFDALHENKTLFNITLHLSIEIINSSFVVTKLCFNKQNIFYVLLSVDNIESRTYFLYFCSVTQNCQKSRRHLKVLGTRTVTLNFYQILGFGLNILGARRSDAQDFCTLLLRYNMIEASM